MSKSIPALFSSFFVMVKTSHKAVNSFIFIPVRIWRCIAECTDGETEAYCTLEIINPCADQAWNAEPPHQTCKPDASICRAFAYKTCTRLILSPQF